MRTHSTRGVTLLEVLAGAALLSLLAVSVMATLQLAAARAEMDGESIRVDELTEIADWSVAAAREQVDAEADDLRELAQAAETMALRGVDDLLPEQQTATTRIVRVVWAGQTYFWLVVEAGDVGASSFVAHEETP